MAAISSNRKQFRKDVLKCVEGFEKGLARGIKELCYEVDDQIKALTPVWRGESVRNYIWTTGNPYQGVYSAVGSGSPGPTNSMILGTEPRRAANEAAARESLTAINFANPFQTFWLSNNAEQIVGLELGLLPGPPLHPRSPNGMFGLVSEYAKARVANKGIIRL